MRSPLLAAFFHPLNLATFGIAIIFGLCAAWWLFPVGLIVWACMLVLVYRDPAMQLNQIVKSRSSLAQRFQKPFDRIQRAQVSLFNNLNATRPKVRRSLQPLQEAVNKLTDQTYHLCLRMTSLQNYFLVTKTNRDFEGELFSQKIKLENTADEATRRDYEESMKTIQEQVTNFRMISTLLDRVEAQLANVTSTLDNGLADMLRFQALRPEDIDKELHTLLQSIHAQSEQLSLFENEATQTKI